MTYSLPIGETLKQTHLPSAMEVTTLSHESSRSSIDPIQVKYRGRRQWSQETKIMQRRAVKLSLSCTQLLWGSNLPFED
ncbi:hypothetical protein V6N11_032187 [Hibiscus sabdariffa]|uniref:Uncharacterized protein n=1 Tax=Hibiscus sabdariffa TaxID=183260 RepID=A0ABR2SZW4_9ROSI